MADGTPALTPSAPHWAYEGEDGPSHWGELSPDYRACSIGKEQSPIDIVDATHRDLSDIGISYSSINPMRIINNGHTIQVNVSADPGTITTGEVSNGIVIDGVHYGLAQFHFHTPSEHHINDAALDMELHLVHMTPDGRAAVFGILLKVGSTNDALAPVFANIAPSKGAEQIIPVSLQPEAFLPSNPATYRYTGSLTTPPCSEGISWLVFTQAVEVGPEQLAIFHTAFADNARPIQELNGREIEEGS